MYVGEFVQAAGATRRCRGVGGDFFDFLDTGLEFHVLIGHASGAGAPAALQAALVQDILAADVEAGTGAARLVAQLNRVLCRRWIADRDVTLFYGVITPDGRLTCCNAAHCPPMLIAPTSVRRLAVGGLPPGLFADARYEEESVPMEPGDALVLFSDGLQWAAGRTGASGEARIQRIVTASRDRSPAAILERLMSGVQDFSGSGGPRDDMTAFVAKHLGGTPRDHGDHPASA